MIRWSFPVDNGSVVDVVISERADGSFATHETGDDLAARRAHLGVEPLTWLRQVHGSDVVVVDAPGAAAGAVADGAVTTCLDAPIGVITADCAPVLLFGRGGVGAVHAGWRGLVAGVLPAAVAALRDLGVSELRGALGPVIGAAWYEFGHEDLRTVEAAVGGPVSARTASGSLALDMSAGVRHSLASVDVPVVAQVGSCTASFPAQWYSHRARADGGRQLSVITRRARSR